MAAGAGAALAELAASPGHQKKSGEYMPSSGGFNYLSDGLKPSTS